MPPPLAPNGATADGAAASKPDSKRAGWRGLRLQMPASWESADMSAIAAAIEEVPFPSDDERPPEPFSPLALPRAAAHLAAEVVSGDERQLLSPEAEAQLRHPT